MNKQRGGFAIGLIVGLLLGLAVALGVALYVTKVPVPFLNKVPQRTAEQDEIEAQRNKNWDPNAPLAGKNASRPATVASGVVTPPPGSAGATAPASASPPDVRNPAAILADRAAATTPSTPNTPGTSAAAAPTPPAAASGAAVSSKPGADPFNYYVQAGAYTRSDDAEQQRAKLAMLGFETKLTEREQSGRTVYRVRVGPFEQKDEAETTKEKLSGAGIDTALVRVQK